jgi:hypothetical protein
MVVPYIRPIRDPLELHPGGRTDIPGIGLLGLAILGGPWRLSRLPYLPRIECNSSPPVAIFSGLIKVRHHASPRQAFHMDNPTRIFSRRLSASSRPVMAEEL